MKLRLPYWFHCRAWRRKNGKLGGGLWAFIRKHEGYYP